MKLSFEESRQAAYDSGSQKARVLTEAWASTQAFCPNCGAERLSKFHNNRPVADFYCANCNEEFELKSQKSKFGPRVVDGAYRTMCERLAAQNNPNLMLLNYSPAAGVDNLLVVPKHFFVTDIIEERKPLGASARRAGWVGCNILLSCVPDAGKIYIVRDRIVLERQSVLEQWRKTMFLRNESAGSRGWLLNVLKCVEDLRAQEFGLGDVYAFEARLSGLYPMNKHVRQKIRQQLQVLRDRGYLEFLGRGRYRLV
ncbi:MAG: DpnI domain-containing protein [Roseiarcus sp.]